MKRFLVLGLALLLVFGCASAAGAKNHHGNPVKDNLPSVSSGSVDGSAYITVAFLTPAKVTFRCGCDILPYYGLVKSYSIRLYNATRQEAVMQATGVLKTDEGFLELGFTEKLFPRDEYRIDFEARTVSPPNSIFNLTLALP